MLDGFYRFLQLTLTQGACEAGLFLPELPTPTSYCSGPCTVLSTNFFALGLLVDGPYFHAWGNFTSRLFMGGAWHLGELSMAVQLAFGVILEGAVVRDF